MPYKYSVLFALLPYKNITSLFVKSAEELGFFLIIKNYEGRV